MLNLYYCNESDNNNNVSVIVYIIIIIIIINNYNNNNSHYYLNTHTIEIKAKMLIMYIIHLVDLRKQFWNNFITFDHIVTVYKVIRWKFDNT